MSTCTVDVLEENLALVKATRRIPNSDWMARLPEALWDIPLCHLAIPGSHDTMTFDLDATSSLEPSQPQILHTLLQVIPCIARPIIYSYSYTQDFGVSGQLDIGVRYFDLRIAHYQKDPAEILRYTHGFYTTLTVQESLSEMREWLNAHPREVLLLDCAAFYDVNSQMHEMLIAALKATFGSKLCPRQEQQQVTLRWMWNAGYQVIVFYDNRDSVSLHEQLWHNIPYLWGDTTDIKKLLEYLNRELQLGRRDGFFVAGMNLTPDSRYIMENLRGSIRQLTEDALPAVMEWLVQQTPGAATACVNVIGTDFTVPDVVSTIISLNWKLLQRVPDATKVLR